MYAGNAPRPQANDRDASRLPRGCLVLLCLTWALLALFFAAVIALVPPTLVWLDGGDPAKIDVPGHIAVAAGIGVVAATYVVWRAMGPIRRKRQHVAAEREQEA